ncbi:MAG: hypothetical protein ACI9A1_001216, partial [Lentimonas sp.]
MQIVQKRKRKEKKGSVQCSMIPVKREKGVSPM